jgi:four helix bundle protein
LISRRFKTTAQRFSSISHIRRCLLAAKFSDKLRLTSNTDFMHFIDITSGSLFETMACFILAERLGYLSPGQLDDIREDADHLGRKLSNFKRSLSNAGR